MDGVIHPDRPASVMLAVRPPRAQPASIAEVRDLLEGAGLEVERFEVSTEPLAPAARYEAFVTARLVDAARRRFRVWLEPAPVDFIENILGMELPWRGLLDEDRENVAAATWAMGVSTVFEGRPLWDYHAQLKVLQAVAPDTVFVLDAEAFSPRPGPWLNEVASSLAPPSPESLFTIHAVGDGEEEPAWLHTHGLERCGAIELEMLDVPGDFAGMAGQLLNVAGSLFIERGIPEPDEPFEVGQGLELCWLPWEDALSKVRRGVPGHREDREDDVHVGTRGVLFVPHKSMLGRRAYRSVAEHRAIMEDNPLLYLSNMATARAALLAKERLHRFRALWSRHQEAEWVFLVKLGYQVDQAEDDNDREHLWFQVHRMAEDQVEATCLNAPYAVSSLSEGQRAHHPLAKLSDWSILCELGRFDADNVGELERLLSQGDDIREQVQ